MGVTKFFGETAAGGVTREIASNAALTTEGIFRSISKFPLLGVTDAGGKSISNRAGDIAEVFSKETQAMRENVSQQVQNLNGEGGILDEIANAHNTANGLSGEQAIGKGNIAEDINAAYTYGRTAKDRASNLADVGGKYGMNASHMDAIQETMDSSSKLADTYTRAGAAPFGIVKDYFLDGSPLSMYAKGATAVTAFQFATGSRTSLTEKEGQKDIAGIPFI